MRIVVLRTDDPFPPRHGGAVRTWTLVQGLLDLGHEVLLLASLPDEKDGNGVGTRPGGQFVDGVRIERLPSLPSWRNPFPHRPEHNQPELLRRAVLSGADLAVVTFTFAAPSALLLEGLGIPTLVDAPGVESRYAASTGIGRGDIDLLTHLDGAAARGASGLLAVCEEDRRTFSSFAGARWDRLHLFPNLGLPPQRVFRGGHEKLLWLGPPSHAPNRAALDHLIAEVMPALWNRRPEARLVLAGRGTEEWVRDPRTVSVGEVEDLDALFADAAALVVPVTQGGGSRVKVADALARGVPVVGTSFGVAGHEDLGGAGQVIANDVGGLVDALAELLADPDAVQALGEKGRQAILRRGGAADFLEPALEPLIAEGAGSGRALRALSEIPGNWPAKAADIPDWLAARPRRVTRAVKAIGRRLTR